MFRRRAALLALALALVAVVVSVMSLFIATQVFYDETQTGAVVWARVAGLAFGSIGAVAGSYAAWAMATWLRISGHLARSR